MTIQFDILTKTRGYSTDEGGIVYNSFYGRSEQEVRDNFEKAREIYAKLIKCFNKTHLMIHGRNIPSELEELIL